MNAAPNAAFVLAPARSPRAASATRLLHVDPAARTFRDERFRDLLELLAPGDLLIVNDAATLPASLSLTSHPAELRLLAHAAPERFRAVVFGGGDWRTPTEARGPAPKLRVGERFASHELSGEVVEVDKDDARLVTVRFDRSGANLWAALYRVGALVQYSYLERPLELWDVQNRFAARPWAFEPPSAGLPLSFELLTKIRGRGVAVAALTHAAGLSSTGSESLDRRLPLPERYEIPERTLAALADSRRRGGRIVAVGTTVVRALESSAAAYGEPRAGEGVAELVIGPGFRPKSVDGLLTGLHDPTTSHFALLQAFAPRELLLRATAHASRSGYLQHEFGDSCLILAGR